jgi:hypothetical protein
MMLAMEDGLVALCIVIAIVDDLLLRAFGVGDGDGSPGAVADPEALLLGGVADVVKADGPAVLLEFVFDLACEGERLGAGEIDAAILELAAGEHGDGDEAAAGGLAGLAGEFEDGDGAEFGCFFAGFGDLAGVLG